MTDAEEGRFVASTIFEQKMQNQMTNSLLFYIVPMHNPLYGGCFIKEISHTVFMEDCLLSKERNKRCFVLCLVLNPKDEEALMRVINYPARGIGNTTIEKIIVAANHHYKRSMFEDAKY
jgi:DNA helicase-2/ATP-dependent DNA helicase PcrA